MTGRISVYYGLTALHAIALLINGESVVAFLGQAVEWLLLRHNPGARIIGNRNIFVLQLPTLK
jgi:hypothetical protein